jgi:hypothetical protein
VCKGGTNTVTQQSSPPAQYLQGYSNTLSQAQGVAAQPYQPYSGNIVAPLTGNQEQAYYNTAYNNPAQAFTPYSNTSQNYLSQATQPLYSTVGAYESPYTADVVNATQNQFNNQNAIQQQQVVGNAAAQGAWGGDRSAVAQGIVAGQQQANEAPTIAGLENTGYQTALSADEAQSWLANSASAQEANLGAVNSGQIANSIGLQESTGGINQSENQANLNVPYEQYLAGQAYPFQTTGWLANIAEGLGSGAGGNSSTTSPSASPLSQAAGLGIGGVGLLGATGAFGSTGYLTGAGGLLSGLTGAGSAAGVSSFGIPTAISALGAPFGFARGGIVPRRDGGGQVADSGIAALLNSMSAFGHPDVSGLRRGGIVRRADGGDIASASPQFSGIPYQQMPLSGSVPNVGISVVPKLPQMHGGMGPPRAPQSMQTGASQNQNLTPQGILGMLQTSGGFGQNGWLKQLSSPTSRRGGQVGLPRFQDGGDLVSGFAPPDQQQPAFLGISPDMRASPVAPGPSAPSGPSVSITPSPSGSASSPLLADAVSGGGLDPLVDHIIRNEGGSPHGVANNPGNIKFAGLPGQIDSGVHATDGGTFASYASPQDGRQAVSDLATRAAKGEIPAYGRSPTVSDFLNTYTGHGAGSAPRRGNQDVGLGTMPPGSPQPPLEAPISTDSSPGIAPVSASPSASGIMGSPAGMYGPGVNPWLALAAAGFATAAGSSPQPMQNLGAGMFEGVKTLESERAALPEQELRLSQAQMARMQVQNAQAMHDYFSGRASDPTPVAGQLDRNIDAVRGAITDAGQTTATPTPTGAVAPLGGTVGAPSPGMGSSSDPSLSASLSSQSGGLSPSEQAIHAQVQQQIANIDSIISQQSDLTRFATTPDQMSQMQGTLANLAIRRSELLKEDPAYIKASSAAGAEGKTPALIQQAAGVAQAQNPALIQRAAGVTAAQTANQFHTAKPGSAFGVGANLTGMVPIQRNEVDPSTGAEYPRFISPPTPGMVPPASGTPGAQSPTGQATPPGIAPGTLPIKLGPGQEVALKERAEAEQKDRQETIEQGEAAQGQQAILMRLKADAPNFVQGPLAQHYQELGTYARLFDPSWNGQVANFEDFVKNAGSLTRAAVRETSARAAVQEFKLIDATLPSPSMSPQGLQQVANEYMGLNDYKVAKAQAQQNWEQQHGGIGNVSGFETAWQGQVSPYAFVFNRMDPTQQRSLVGQLRGSSEGQRELSHLAQQLHYIKGSGLEPYIQ